MFGNIPDAWVVVFYTVTPILILYGAWNFSPPGPELGAGRARPAHDHDEELHDAAATTSSRGVYMQTLLRDPAAGLMHSLLYFGFLLLLAVTTVLEIDHQMPDDLKFLHGDVYQGYALVGDVAGVAFLVGILLAIYRRYIQRVYRIRIKSKPEHAVILGTFLVLGLTGFGAEAFRIALNGRPELRAVERRRLAARPGSSTAGAPTRSQAWHRGWWIAHVLSLLRVPRHPADHDAAPHVHEPAEHVPARRRSARRAR